MSELSAWDLDGTIRPGSLLGAAIMHGVTEGFIDPSHYSDPVNPTYAEAGLFLKDITNRSRKEFTGLMTLLSDSARSDAYPWAIEQLDEQMQSGTVAVLSHSPDFLVRAFCRGLGIAKASGSYFHTKQHIFSGHAVLLNKHQTLTRHMRETGAIQVSFAAGDSNNDLPMLVRAKHAAVVNPDENLAALAEQNGWRIVRADA